jgi:hypothetical protein
MRPLILSLIMMGLTACGDAYAPPVKDTKWIVRVAYIHDLEIKPADTPRGCEVPRKFAEKELPEMPGYTKVVRCLPIGEVN